MMQRRAMARLLLLAWFLAVPALLAAQEMRTVTGTVTVEESMQPLPGVQVSVKGTKIGTLTDGQGYFSLRVPPSGETLVFTYLGYKTEEVPVSDNVEVTMTREVIGLEGLVVTALGVEREKRSLGYSVQDVTGDELAAVPEVNIINSLHGNVAGVHVTNAGPTGGTSRIIIRGASSISGNNEPLIVVDGIPIDNSAPGNAGYGGIDYGNAAQDIDPANVQSISVLKGPNAAALYGSRAANGAIVITTKSGRGAGSQGLGMTVSLSTTAETPLRLPEYQNQYGQGILGQFQWVDGAGGGLWDHVDESWGPRLDGQPIDQFTGAGMPWVAHPDNVRSYFRTGYTLNTNVAVARASESSNIRLSLTNARINGMAPGNTIDRLGVALKGGASLTDRLNAEASLNYINQDANNRIGTGYDEDNPMQSFGWFGRQVDMEALRHYRCDGTEPTPCVVGGQYNWNYNYHNNPFWEQLVNTNGDERDRVIGHVQVGYQLTDWLTASGRVGRDWYRDHRKRVTAPHSLDDAGDGSFGEDVLYRAETNADLTLSATRSLMPDLTLDVNAGGNLRYNSYERNSVTVSRLTVPGIYTIDNAAVTPNPTDYMSKKEIRSLFGSVSLNYMGYLNLDLTGRNDWSSTLPADNNSYFYPSVSSAFVFTDALGLQSSLLSSGKIRASWTRVGNDADPYQLQSVYSAQQGWGGSPMFAVPNELPNINLKPEETTAYEVGTDLGFFDERLGFVVTYYNRSTKNQILGVQISAASGYTNQVLNAGEVQNTGIELLLRATPIRMDNGFRWDMTVNWSKNQSEVTDLYGDLETLVLGSYWSLNIEARKGEPYGVMFGNGYLRCKQADVTAGDCTSDQIGMLMLRADGMPRQDPVRRVLGNYNPDWVGGIQNRFSYGPFDLSILLDGQMGGDVFSVTNWFGEYAGVMKTTLRGRENNDGFDSAGNPVGESIQSGLYCDPGIAERGVLPDGSVNGDGVNDVYVCPIDFFGRNYGIHEASIDDASYLKLRELRLGYEIPANVANILGFSGGSVSLIGRNLFLYAPNIKNIDPETAFDASNVQGIEYGQFPTARSIGFAISLRP